MVLARALSEVWLGGVAGHLFLRLAVRISGLMAIGVQGRRPGDISSGVGPERRLWSTHPVSAVFASLIAVVGTLLGSLSTFLFQQRTAVRAEVAVREERLRQERLAAYSAFAAAVTELKRGVVAAWL
jgi:hypothetical protein